MNVKSFLDYQRGDSLILPVPHIWERIIGVARHILNNVMIDVVPGKVTRQVLVTFMAEVCAIVKPRPIVPVSLIWTHLFSALDASHREDESCY